MKKEELIELLGNANEFKEGDLSVGVGTYDDAIRADAKQTLSRVRLNDIFSCHIIEDKLTHRLKSRFIEDQSSANAFSSIKNIFLIQGIDHNRNIRIHNLHSCF